MDERAEHPAPLIITCAITGDHQQREHPALPVTAEEQAAAAAAVLAAGAAIVHIHGRDAMDPSRPARQAACYREIADAIRQQAPDAILDFTQTALPLPGVREMSGSLHRYAAVAMDAAPEIMSLNPGPMTFRGSQGDPSPVLVTSFDDTARIAGALREREIKPQIFLYHPGHLDLLDHLIRFDLLARPYWVQLVFGQQAGIAATPASVLYMIQHLPADCLFQTCALGLASLPAALLSLLHGGHVRTGMEDSLFFRPGEPVTDNAQLVSRIVRIASDLGRPVAPPSDVRQMLGLRGTP